MSLLFVVSLGLSFMVSLCFCGMSWWFVGGISRCSWCVWPFVVSLDVRGVSWSVVRGVTWSVVRGVSRSSDVRGVSRSLVCLCDSWCVSVVGGCRGVSRSVVRGVSWSFVVRGVSRSVVRGISLCSWCVLVCRSWCISTPPVFATIFFRINFATTIGTSILVLFCLI